MFVNILPNCVFFYLRSKFLTMPSYYAVAVGRCVGIYDNYDDCKLQISHFPNAKFKKFESIHDAQEYISKFSKPCLTNNGLAMQVDDVKSVPSLSRLGQVSQKEVGLQEIFDKLSRLEEKFNQFVSSTSSILEDFKIRLCNIETSCASGVKVGSLRPAKRLKLDEPAVEVDESIYLKNGEGVVMVYTDGACVNNGAKGAKAGIGIWFNHGHPLNVSAPLKGPATNNNAEIQAARVAINQAAKAGIKQLCIHTDSKFLISCITEWIHKWKKNSWKLKSGEDVKNRVELEKLDLALQQLEKVEWIHVKGHKGIEGNEMADKLARDGVSRYQINVTYSDYSDI